MAELSHVDSNGKANMVDVSAKNTAHREAIAEAIVRLNSEAYHALKSGVLKKGDAIAVARVAGIMAAKRTAELIPLCHTLPLTHVAVDVEWMDEDSQVRITGTARTSAQTGVEMEALTAVTVAALTIYDMCKAVDKTIVIEGIHLLSKSKVEIVQTT